MTVQVVFVPLSHQEASALRVGVSPAGTRLGQAATPALMRAHDYDSSTLEDAEFAALSYAAVQALLDPDIDDELRLVLAAEVPSAAVDIRPDDPYGTVEVRGLDWSAVRALFADELVARPAVAAARVAGRGRSLEEALALTAVEALSETSHLLWFHPDELDRLSSP